MDRDELTSRSRRFALRVLKLADALPKSVSGRAVANQVVRSATSVAANYRAARRARSKKEFAAKIGIVVEEIDETEFWLGLIVDGELMSKNKIAPLRQEAEELTRIFATTRRTALNR